MLSNSIVEQDRAHLIHPVSSGGASVAAGEQQGHSDDGQ